MVLDSLPESAQASDNAPESLSVCPTQPPDIVHSVNEKDKSPSPVLVDIAAIEDDSTEVHSSLKGAY